MSEVIVRPEANQAGEWSRIHTLNEAAFGRADEAILVDNLRGQGDVLLSLVAESGGQIVGHILFSRMWVHAHERTIPAAALAPVAVDSAHQRQGIAARLIRRGLELMRDAGEQVVIVLGETEYYSRFGFACKTASGLESPFPPEAYMARELKANALGGVRGKVQYAAAFGV